MRRCVVCGEYFVRIAKPRCRNRLEQTSFVSFMVVVAVVVVDVKMMMLLFSF